MHRFSFSLVSLVEGDLTLSFGSEDPIVQPIVVDYHLKKIRSPDGGPDEIEISAIEAVD